MKQKVDEFEDSLDCMKFVNSINQLKLDVKKLKRQSLYNTSDNRPDPENNYLDNESNMNPKEDNKIDDEEEIKTPNKYHYLSESQILALKLSNPSHSK